MKVYMSLQVWESGKSCCLKTKVWVELNEVKVSQKVLGMGSGTLFLHKLEQVPTI